MSNCCQNGIPFRIFSHSPSDPCSCLIGQGALNENKRKFFESNKNNACNRLTYTVLTNCLSLFLVLLSVCSRIAPRTSLKGALWAFTSRALLAHPRSVHVNSASYELHDWEILDYQKNNLTKKKQKIKRNKKCRDQYQWEVLTKMFMDKEEFMKEMIADKIFQNFKNIF